jgi:hypothetical protein
MWLRGLACGALVLGLATPAGAAHVNLHSSIGVASAYLRVADRETPNDPLEDVQTREHLASTLTLDNAYVHSEIRYRISAVQLQRNEDLNYLDHHAGIRVDANRWLRRFTQSGRLTITADLHINPSLPPLGPDETSVPSTEAPADTGPGGPVPEDLVGIGDLTTIREDRSGYAMKYGIAYEDELSPFSGYRVGALVRDTRNNSSVVQDSASLILNAEEYARLRAGLAGVGVSHARLIRGGATNNKTYEMYGFLSRTGYRTGWRIAPGIAYRTQAKTYSGTLATQGYLRQRILTYFAHYRTGYQFLHIGTTPLARTHRLGVSIGGTRPTHYPRYLVAEALVGGRTKEATLNLTQAARFTPRIRGRVGYERGLLRWVDLATGATRKRHSDAVRVSLDWQFL